MTPHEFRRMALRLPDAVEAAHGGHPDFRVAGRIFATLGYPRPGFGVVVLSPEDQAFFVQAQREVFAPVAGAWGARGSTTVTLAAANRALVRAALRAAWQRRVGRTAPASRSRAGRRGKGTHRK